MVKKSKKSKVVCVNSGFRYFDLSFKEATLLKLLVSSKLAELYFSSFHSNFSDKLYLDNLVTIHHKLDDLINCFVDDLPF